MHNRRSGAYRGSLRARYLRARKKEKGVILDEFTNTNGSNRDYASCLLFRADTHTSHAQFVIRVPTTTMRQKSPRWNTWGSCWMACARSC